MGNHPRKADGRRVFSPEFKRTTVQRILTGEKTVAELSRELDIVPSVIRTWARRSEAGAATAVAANEDVVPASQLREAYSRIRELERLLGRKQMEIEILEAARDIVKKVRGCAKGPGGDGAGDDGGLLHAGGEPADGVLRPPGAPAGALSAGRRCGGPPADPRGDQQPGHLWLPPGLGDGESDLSYRLQPQADSAGHAAARAHAAPTGPPAARAAAPRPDPAAGVEPALVLRCVLDSLLERRGPLGGLRDRLSRSRGPGLRGVAAAAGRGAHPHAHGPGALGPLRRGDAQGPPRDSVAQRQRPSVHGDGHRALRPRAGPGPDHDAGV